MVKMEEYKNNNYDVFAGHFLAIYQILYISNVTLAQVKGLNRLNNLFSIAMALFFGAYMLYKRQMMTRCWKIIMLFWTAFGLMYIFGALKYHNTSFELLSHIYWSLLYCIPLGCVWYKVDRFDIAIYQTKKACLISTFCGLMVCLLPHIGMGDFGHTGYNMSLGYSLLFPALFYINYIKEKRHYIFLALINIGVIIFAGSRGPVLCLAIYLLFIYFAKKGIKSKGGVIAFSLIILFGLVLILNFSAIMQWIVDTLDEHGIYSRTLSYLAYRTFYSGREEIWSEAVHRIAEKAFTGWGIGYDNSAMIGLIPHNLFLELLISYGCIFGSMISIVVIICIWKKALISSIKKTIYSDIGIMLLSIGFIPLMISFTYLTWPYFWLLLAFCLNKNRKTHRTTMRQL
jgi:hypothetical protein